MLVVTPITAIGTPRSLCARLRDRRADGLLPVARAAAAAAGHRGRGAGRDRARGRAAAEPGDRPRRPVVRLPHVRRGARHAGVGALRLGADLRPDHVAARRARDAADQDDASRSTGSSRTSRTSTASAGSCAACPTPTGRRPRPTSSRAGAPARSGPGRRTVTVRGLRGDAYAGAGTTLSVDGGDREAIADLLARHLAGRQGAQGRRLLPHPLPRAAAERARAVGGQQRLARPAGRRAADHAAAARARAAGPGRHALAAGHLGQARAAAVRLRRPAAGRERAPRHRPSPGSRRCATRPTGGRGSSPSSSSAARARRTSTSAASTPTSAGASATTSGPAPAKPGQVPLEHFLFDTKAGYCQHFSGAMALLLRFGGIPARVATGFSPGGFRKRQGEWVVRDRDAHSWVEAWFDGIGWVTFDPTPTATPARSLIAAIADPNSGSPERRRRRRARHPARHPQPGRRAARARPGHPAERHRRRRRRPRDEPVALRRRRGRPARAARARRAPDPPPPRRPAAAAGRARGRRPRRSPCAAPAARSPPA